MTESLGFQFYEQRLSGLKTTEAAEVAKLTRMGTDAYMADKQAEVAPLIEAHIAKLKEQQKNKGFSGLRTTSKNRPQDIGEQWRKTEGRVMTLPHTRYDFGRYLRRFYL